jgi:hypothetical protein
VPQFFCGFQTGQLKLQGRTRFIQFSITRIRSQPRTRASFDPDVQVGDLLTVYRFLLLDCQLSRPHFSDYGTILKILRYTSSFRDGTPITQSCRTKLF